MQHYVQPYRSGLDMDCGMPLGDARGNLMLPVYWDHATSILVIPGGDPSTPQTAGSWGMSDRFYVQPTGFIDIGYPYLGPCAEELAIEDWSIDSAPTASRTQWAYGQYVAAPDPRGGLLVAGTLATTTCDASAELQRVAIMLKGGSDGTEVRWGPAALAASGDILGAGVDENGRAIVLTRRTPSSGEEMISAQWFDADGTSLTGEFDLFSRATAGGAASFDVSPLIGGGVLVSARGATFDFAGVLQRRTHAPVGVLASGSTQLSPAPGWIKARPNARFQILPNGSGYAVLPDGAVGVDCMQRVEVLTRDGTACGQHDYRIADGTCDTLDLQLGLDGSVLQRLPVSLESHDEYDNFHSCTWRWWPGALKR